MSANGIIPLSVCIITKNDAYKLAKCLKALKGKPWEIVVADTGSTDGSRDIVIQAGAKLCSFEWCDDFSAARNFVASEASNDMILMLDTDEYLKDTDAELLSRDIEDNPQKIGRIRRDNLVMNAGEEQHEMEFISRIYDRRIYHYEGRVHEQIVPLDKDVAPGYYQTGVSVLHDGYIKTGESGNDKAENKADRNRRLLLLELKDHEDDPYILYQLGKTEYYSGNYEKAAEYLGKMLGIDLDPALAYLTEAIETYGYSLLKTGRNEEALAFQNLYEIYGGTADFQFLMGLIYMNNGYFDAAVDEFEKAAVNPVSNRREIGEYMAYFNAGVVRECMGDIPAAERYYGKCGDYAKAAERLEALKKKG